MEHFAAVLRDDAVDVGEFGIGELPVGRARVRLRPARATSRRR